MIANTIEIMNRGMKCLTESLGVVDAEQFISAVIREKFDYTKWQKQYFDSMNPDEFHRNALAYSNYHPYSEAGKRI